MAIYSPDCDVIHLLPGWERSKGAGVELAVEYATT